MDMYKKKGKHPTGKTVGDSMNLALIIIHHQPDRMKSPMMPPNQRNNDTTGQTA